jgi:hypothetical protein
MENWWHHPETNFLLSQDPYLFLLLQANSYFPSGNGVRFFFLVKNGELFFRSERNEFGYKTFQHLATASKSKLETFRRIAELGFGNYRRKFLILVVLEPSD